MNTPIIIRTLASLRLEEARILADNDKPDGAFYLAGYSVELTLKARIAEQFGIESLFADKVSAADDFTDIGKVKNLVQTHNLFLLLVMSGLRLPYFQKRQQDKIFLKFDPRLWTWNERLRYQLPGRFSQQDVTEFIDFLAAPDGLLTWIKNK